MEKKNQAIAAEAEAELNQHDKSIDDADLNKTGEMSKLSNQKDDANRKSKEKTSVEPKAESLKEQSVDGDKSGLGHALSMGSLHGQLPERDNIDNDFKPVIIELWRDMAKNYKGQMKRVFRNIRLQREQASIRNSSIKSQFLEFLNTKDGK